jgi:hypothetical protein
VNNKETLNGFLEFTSRKGEMQDYVSLCDEGAPGQMGGMGLSMESLRRFHGKEVTLTVELLEVKPAGPR